MTVWERRQVGAVAARVGALIALGVVFTVAIDAAAGGDAPLARARSLAPEILLFSGTLGAAQWAAGLHRNATWLAHRAAGGHPLRLAVPVAAAGALIGAAWLGVARLGPTPDAAREGGDRPQAWMERLDSDAVVLWWRDGTGRPARGRVVSGHGRDVRVRAASGLPARNAADVGGAPPRGDGWGAVLVTSALAAAALALRAPRGRPRRIAGEIRGEASALGLGLVIGFAVLGLELTARVVRGPSWLLPVGLALAGALAWTHLGASARTRISVNPWRRRGPRRRSERGCVASD